MTPPVLSTDTRREVTIRLDAIAGWTDHLQNGRTTPELALAGIRGLVDRCKALLDASEADGGEPAQCPVVHNAP